MQHYITKFVICKHKLPKMLKKRYFETIGESFQKSFFISKTK